jgi:anti-anti-sigma regulatory factor/anti-sigma regulatory factor (Ser/Thr protein kinase)
MADIWSEVDQVDTRLLVRLHGELSTATVPRIRMLLLKRLVDQPDALVVEVSGLVVRDEVALHVFMAVARQAAVWPGTPLLICAGEPRLARLLTHGSYGRLPVFPSIAEALAAPARKRIRTLSEPLLPVAGAVHRARELAAGACVRWHLPRLTNPAVLIAGELVANAVRHAQTIADLRFSLGRRYLMIAVRDGSTELPKVDDASSGDPGRGRGLVLVDALAARWGSMASEGGKVVWASLPIETPRRPDPGA